MDIDGNKAIVRRLLEECLAGGDLDGLDEIVAERYAQRDSSMPSGRDALKRFFAGFRSAFSDLQVRVEDLVAEGDKVVAVTVSSATHGGSFSGLPASGRRVEFRSMDIYRIDELGLLEQLGVKHDLAWPGQPQL